MDCCFFLVTYLISEDIDLSVELINNFDIEILVFGFDWELLKVVYFNFIAYLFFLGFPLLLDLNQLDFDSFLVCVGIIPTKICLLSWF